MYTYAVLTVSDKGSKNERVDESGKTIIEIMDFSGYELKEYDIVADEVEEIKAKLIEYADKGINLILTTGGTGFSKRDVTPEATLEVGEKNVPGISEAIRAYSLKITPKAMLSRAVSVIRKDSLIINLPGSPKACRESLEFILDPLSHGLDILNGNSSECARK
ncbi:MAG: MogA/MoaB family molybdenum cofactor biosynthesis protein [Finegoldia sp.]|nr:MogA/MoaB family molybdenum cofactor biosynthesis protein [Finegoldia sp.]